MCFTWHAAESSIMNLSYTRKEKESFSKYEQSLPKWCLLVRQHHSKAVKQTYNPKCRYENASIKQKFMFSFLKKAQPNEAMIFSAQGDGSCCLKSSLPLTFFLYTSLKPRLVRKNSLHLVSLLHGAYWVVKISLLWYTGILTCYVHVNIQVVIDLCHSRHFDMSKQEKHSCK